MSSALRLTRSARLATLGIGRCHLVGASFGASVAVEVALTPARAGGRTVAQRARWTLIAEVTPDLRAFIEAERAALAVMTRTVPSRQTWTGGLTPQLVGALELQAIHHAARCVTDGIASARRVD